MVAEEVQGLAWQVQPLRSRGPRKTRESDAPGAQGSRAGGWNSQAKLQRCERWWSRLGLQCLKVGRWHLG